MRANVVNAGVMIFSLTFSACVSTTSDPSCTEFKQAERNASLTVDIARKYKAEGKIDSKKLIEVDQDAAIYAKRIKDLCTFFEADKIKFPEYQAGLSQANNDYERIRTNLNAAAEVKQKEPSDASGVSGDK